MKKIMNLLMSLVNIIPFSFVLQSCAKEADNSIKSDEVINKLKNYNNETITLNDINNNYIDLTNKENVDKILNVFGLTSDEKKLVSSLSTYNNTFYINKEKNIEFDIKDNIYSSSVKKVNLLIEWTNNLKNGSNYTLLKNISKLMNDYKGTIELNDDSISDNSGNSINLNNSYVQSSIWTELNLNTDFKFDYSDFYFINNIKSTTGNILENNKKDTILFQFTDYNGHYFDATLQIIWHYVQNNNLLFKELSNQINNKFTVEAKGDNLDNNYNNSITKNAILNDIGISKEQYKYVSLSSEYPSLIMNHYINLHYDIKVDTLNVNIDKNTILYSQVNSFSKSNAYNTVYSKINKSYYTIIDNSIWKYDVFTNDFIKININSVFSGASIQSIYCYNGNLYVNFKDLGFGVLDKNNNQVEPRYIGAPNIVNSYFYYENRIYLGSDKSGLCYLDMSNDQIIHYINNIRPKILSIFNYEDKIYCGIQYDRNHGGIWYMQDSTIHEWSASVGVLSYLSVYKVVNINDIFYALTSDGIYFMKKSDSKFQKLQTHTDLDNSSLISYYYNDVNNVLYVGTFSSGLWDINLDTKISNSLVSSNIKNTDKISSITMYKQILLLNKSNINIDPNNNLPGRWYYNVS